MVYQREIDNYAQLILEQKIAKNEKLVDNKAFKVSMMKYNALTVPEYRNKPKSIGFTMNIFKEKLYNEEDIKLLKIDGVYPNQKNISQGTYPLGIPYYGIIHRDEEQNHPKEFLDWILSNEGQKSLEQAGYFPLH